MARRLALVAALAIVGIHCSENTRPVKGTSRSSSKARPAVRTAPRAAMGPGTPSQAELSIQQAMQIKRGEDALAARRPAEALKHLSQALHTLPTSRRAAEIHLLMGQAYEMTDQHQLAIAAYEKAVALEPAQPAGHYLLAMAYKAAKRYDRAHAAIRKAISLAPRNLAYRFDRVTIELDRGWKLQAESSYREYEKRRNDVIALLKAGDVRKRLLALAALAAVPSDRVNLTALQGVLADPKPEIRAAAARALGASGTRDPAVRKALQSRLESEQDATVSKALRGALARLPLPPMLPRK